MNDVIENCICCGKRRKRLDEFQWCDGCSNIVVLAIKHGKARPPKQKKPNTRILYREEKKLKNKNRRKSRWFTHSSTE